MAPDVEIDRDLTSTKGHKTIDESKDILTPHFRQPSILRR
jgi:hypothetical protein